MNRLIAISNTDDILPEYRQNPIGLLLEYHNLKRPSDKYDDAGLLIGTCMDRRIHLYIPDNFAFIIRSGGANLRYSEFTVSCAIAVWNVRHIALIGHNKCGMVNLVSRKEQFIKGIVETTGWDTGRAEDNFLQFAPMFEIGNELDFILSETKRLRLRYPKIQIAPMMYLVEDNRLYLVNEN
jgi:carbonic anhydrase